MPRVTVLPDAEHITAEEGETVLAALGRAGFRYRIGCRRGGCGVCKVHLSLGEVRYERPIDPSVLTDSERVEGVCLSCRAVPITNVVIELQDGDRLRRVLPFGFASAAPTRTGSSGGPGPPRASKPPQAGDRRSATASRPAPDRPAQDQPAPDRPAQDQPAQDQPARSQA